METNLKDITKFSLLDLYDTERVFEEYSLDYLNSIINKEEKLDICRCNLLRIGQPEYIYKNSLGTLILKMDLYESTFDFIGIEDLKDIMKYVLNLDYPRYHIKNI